MSETQTPLRRGLVLLALKAQYPLPLTRVALDRQLGPFYATDPRDLARDLAYLAERGFLRRDSHEVGGLTFATICLTAAGVDVVERIVKDPGVEIASS